MLSIGITTYKRRDFLRTLVASILDQDCDEFEVLIGNDCTEDPISAAAPGLADRRIRIINHPENLGELDNMNALLHRASGSHFTWMADDDMLAPGFIRSAMSTIAENPGIKCIYTGFTEFSDDSGLVRTKNPQTSSFQASVISGKEFVRGFWTAKIRVIGTSGIFDVAWLKGAGGLKKLSSSRFALYSEYELVLRAAALDRVAYINQPLVLYRNYPESWGASNTEARLYVEAGISLTRAGARHLSIPALAGDFRKNIRALMRMCLYYISGKNLQTGKPQPFRDGLEYLIGVWKPVTSFPGGTTACLLAVCTGIWLLSKVLVRTLVSGALFNNRRKCSDR